MLDHTIAKITLPDDVKYPHAILYFQQTNKMRLIRMSCSSVPSRVMSSCKGPNVSRHDQTHPLGDNFVLPVPPFDAHKRCYRGSVEPVANDGRRAPCNNRVWWNVPSHDCTRCNDGTITNRNPWQYKAPHP
jgi:hypothetical protein